VKPAIPRSRVSRRIQPGVVGTALVVLLLDQVTKFAVTQTLGQPGEIHSIDIVGSWVRLSYTTNTGAAFGIFPTGTLFFTAVAIIAVPILLVARSYIADRSWWVTVVFGMLVGGALGNLIDRLRMGHVVDFIDVGIGDLRWPAFNIADSSFVIGVIILALFLGLSGERRGELAGDDRPDQPHAV